MKVTLPILCVVGARPNFMKMAPLIAAFGRHSGVPGTLLVHTGQHYDAEMNDRLFQDLRLPPPDINLGVGSGSHAAQTAEVMRRFEPLVDAHEPACVIVVGDVNSTLACSLVAAKKQVPVIHVEAGLRSFDRSMPEEINRVLTDQISALLYTTERAAHENLAREGIPPERVHFVGNLMIDSLVAHRERAVPATEIFRREGLCTETWKHYAVVTLHRQSNVDQSDRLRGILQTLREGAQSLPLVWPVHPRTRANIERFGLKSLIDARSMLLLPPQGYLEMLGLMSTAALVLTDSGGIQEETTALGVPCLTMRENTERPITIEQGTNTLVGLDRQAILNAIEDVLKTGGKRGRVPDLWDGRTAGRIADHLAQWLTEARVHA